MQSLLRWSIENSTPQDSSGLNNTLPASNQRLDPGVIDLILGKSEAEQMKKDVAVAIDVRISQYDRLKALDHLEMLVEQIDNANDLEKLNLWNPLISLLNSDASVEIKVQVLWVIGTAIQNNPAAQDAYLALGPLPTVLHFLTSSTSVAQGARARAVYTLSGLLKHNAPAVAALGRPDIDGWSKIRDSLQDPDINVRRKMAFLLNTLLLPATPTVGVAQPAATGQGPELHTAGGPTANNPAPIHANSHSAHLRDPSRTDTSGITLEALERYDIVGAVISAVVDPLPFGEDGEHDQQDPDFEEKAVRMLYTYIVPCRGWLSSTEKQVLQAWIENEKKEIGGAGRLAERLNLSVTELNALVRRLD